MNQKQLLGSVLALILLGPALGQSNDKGVSNDLSDRVRALKFLRGHIIGKTVASPESVVTYSGGKIEGVWSGTDCYTNLVVTAVGFQFDVVSISKLTNYDLDKEGKRIKPGRNEDAAYVTRYDLTARKSTGKLVGAARILTSTHKTFTAGQTVAILMTVDETGLSTTEHNLFYEDFFAAGGAWKAGAAETKIRFSLDRNKLVVQGESQQFDVDPSTLKKTRTTDPALKWTSNQTD